MRSLRIPLSSVLLFVVAAAARADGPTAADFKPDPKSVQRYGAGYRYPQAGWVVLHIEGEPYERGYQHGRLMAPEIAGHVRCFAAVRSPKSPEDGWKHTRLLTNALFLRRYEKEYLEEMRGIADGAAAAGAKFQGRPIDLLDVATLNAWPEIETLDGALDALPVGLEGQRFAKAQPQAMPDPKPMHCSAFAATGPATKDGKIVFGHITMFSLYPSNFYNVWLDVKPSKGHRVFMQTFPAGIQSGMDYYFNDAGLLCSETTIRQTKFDITGQALASRIRKALQYADNIDKAAEILAEGNNGLYTNEWLLGDTKTNEIAMFELGTHKTRLWRSSKNEWFGDTPGFYWGCNNEKDLQVRLETIAGTNDRPRNIVWHPSDRDKKWVELYKAHAGKMDVNFGKLAFTTPPLAAYSSLDAKFTTTDMAKELKTWALFGPPLGRTWQPTFEERQRYPEVQPLVSNPWTVLHAQPPAKDDGKGPKVVDVKGTLEPAPTPEQRRRREGARTVAEPAWRGTLLPKTDADVWLAAAFADYEPIFSHERRLKEQATDGKLSDHDREALAVDLFAYRSRYLAAVVASSRYLAGVRASEEVALSKIRSQHDRDEWYRIASGKGVLLLHEVRKMLGDDKFADMMDAFGRDHAGKQVTTTEFLAHVAKWPNGSNSAEVLAHWFNNGGFPGHNASSVFTVHSFHRELEQTLIVYGTLDEVYTNREAAEALQDAIRKGPNITVPIKADKDVTDADLKDHHLLLIGRPDSNRCVARFQAAVPITFGSRSFTVGKECYAHANSAVLAAGENPLNPRYSIVVIAGLDAASTLRTASALVGGGVREAEVVILPNGERPRNLVVSISLN
jgi:hypothetical protein